MTFTKEFTTNKKRTKFNQLIFEITKNLSDKMMSQYFVIDQIGNFQRKYN